MAREDFLFSRGALRTVATDAQNALHRAVDVATQTDTPKAYEAVAEIVRATVEVHRELQGIHKTAAETRLATAAAKEPQSPVNVDKAIVFAGTSEELLRLISKDRS